MTGMIIPTVTTADMPVPWWARGGIGRAKRHLQQPECILAAWVTYIPAWVIPQPEAWCGVSFDVDGVTVVDVVAPPSDLWAAGAIPAGRHRYDVVPGSERGMVEPVTLNLQPGTVVLVKVQPVNYRWLRWMSPWPPSVSYRILPHGFAHNGRWGERWSRRLGWSSEPDVAGL